MVKHECESTCEKEERIRKLEISLATILERLLSIDNRLKKSTTEKYAYLAVGSGFAYLIQRAFG